MGGVKGWEEISDSTPGRPPGSGSSWETEGFPETQPDSVEGDASGRMAGRRAIGNRAPARTAHAEVQLRGSMGDEVVARFGVDGAAGGNGSKRDACGGDEIRRGYVEPSVLHRRQDEAGGGRRRRSR